jgi:hypothetical protein
MDRSARKYSAILAHEGLFAKSVALQVRVRMLRQPYWHYFVPFKFVGEFFAARRDIARFKETYLFVPHLALDAARRILQSADRETETREISGKLENWLATHGFSSPDVFQKQLHRAILLIDHYLSLLRADGRDYETLVKQAYKTRTNYDAVLRQLASTENEIDQKVLAFRGNADDVLRRRISIKQEVMREIRERELGEVFR